MLTRLVAGASALALALALVWMHGNARYQAGEMHERASWEHAAAQSERDAADKRVAAADRVARAADAYARKMDAIEPVVLRSKDTVTIYAQSPAGTSPCLPADRVRGIDADAAALGLQSASPASDSDTSLRPDADHAQR